MAIWSVMSGLELALWCWLLAARRNVQNDLVRVENAVWAILCEAAREFGSADQGAFADRVRKNGWG
ncbi:hypothetical protein IP69_21250 [Bosea sp. AAP35]|nr:hypothetical protein IP69_21250 [Bosea sp. AAP35]